MNVANTIKKLGLEQAFDYLYKEPAEANELGGQIFRWGICIPT